MLAAALSALAVMYYDTPRGHRLAFSLNGLSRFFLLLATGVFISWLTGRQKRAEEALRTLSNDLERRIREGTSELRKANEVLRVEIVERKRTQGLLEGQKRVLEMMATGAPLPDSLAALTRLIEAQVPGMLGSILLLDEHAGRLRHGAAPSLPPEYVAAIDALPIGPHAGSCGTAAYCKEPVFVEDIATDPRWKDYRAAALPHGLRACWSTPIFDAQRQVLGTFAMYYRQPGLPDPEHLRLIEVATQIAAIAIRGHRVQAVLRESEARLKEAQRLANIGYWDRDLITGRITWSEETYRIFGQPKWGAFVSQDKLQEMIYPDDRHLQSEALQNALVGGCKYDVEYRIVLPNGQIRFVHVWDEIERDPSGRVIRIFGTVQDITERKRAEVMGRESQQLLRLVLATLPVGVAVTDQAGDIALANAAAKRVWGDTIVSGRERWIQSKGFWHDSGKRIAPADWASVRALSEGKTSLNELIDIETFEGKRKTIQNSSVPVRNAEGLIVGAVIVNEDVTERVRAEEALKSSHAQLRALTARLESLREEEATRIAREIHDDLGQKLTGLKMDLQSAERKIEGLESSPVANSLLDAIVSATELADSITASVQEIAANLRPEMLDKLGLCAALCFESRRFQERTGVLCDAHMPETEPNLSKEVSNSLFRIFQECLTNVARHAHATRIEATLKLEDGWATLACRMMGGELPKLRWPILNRSACWE
jgi:PAS domain S-box-containing protein